MTLGRLDYLYTPSDDVAADLRYFVDILGAELGFAIEDGGIRVAMVELGSPPAILLTDHLEGDRPVHLYAVEDLGAVRRDLETRGWKEERAVELPRPRKLDVSYEPYSVELVHSLRERISAFRANAA